MLGDAWKDLKFKKFNLDAKEVRIHKPRIQNFLLNDLTGLKENSLDCFGKLVLFCFHVL